MKKVVLCLFPLILLFAPMFSLADNLMGDPGFELSTPNGTFPDSGSWTPSWALVSAGAVCTTTAAHSGTKGLWVYTGNDTGAYWSGPYQEFAVLPGDVVRAQGWARTPSGQPWVDGSKAIIRLKFLDVSHSPIGLYDSNAVTDANTDWTVLNVQTPPAPENTAFVRLLFYLEKPQIAGQSVVNFDNATLTVSQVAHLGVSKGALGFGETETQLTFDIDNVGWDTLTWSITEDADWVSITPASGSTTTEKDTITVNVDRSDLELERYHTTIHVTSNGGTKDVDVYMETPRPYKVPDQPSIVTVEGRQLMVQRRLPDGSLDSKQPFTIKGAAWAPASVGTLPDPFSRQAEFANWYQLDIAMLKAMNANTVYVFLDFGTDAPAFDLLDTLYKNDVMAIVTVDWDGSNKTTRIATVVGAYKDHPAVLMWAIGNEWNINLYHNKFSNIDDAAVATQAAALQIKALDTQHPVTSIYGEIEILPDQPLDKTQAIVTTVCTAVDVWGLNIYRGDNFGSLFVQWKSISEKPMFLSEFGTDSYFSAVHHDPVDGYIDETAQKNYLQTQWQDIVPELSSQDAAKVCLGGTVFEWSDEWWKVKAEDGGSPDTHDNGGFETPWNPMAHPDGFANEEYFGVVGIDRSKKEAYNILKDAFGIYAVTARHRGLITVLNSILME